MVNLHVYRSKTASPISSWETCIDGDTSFTENNTFAYTKDAFCPCGRLLTIIKMWPVQVADNHIKMQAHSRNNHTPISVQEGRSTLVQLQNTQPFEGLLHVNQAKYVKLYQVREIASKCTTGHQELRWQVPALECMQEVCGLSHIQLTLFLPLQWNNMKYLMEDSMKC